jgi:Carboxypeptidase regulatory-like domain/TonB dependent receptor-like, beta-barrel
MNWAKALALTFLVGLVLAVGSGRGFAQGRQESTLVGSVADSTGGVLPGVSVTVTSPVLVGGPETTVTDSDGKYRVSGLKVGLYEVTFELSGFATVVHSELRIPVATTVTVNVIMQVASVAETVTVTGETPVVDVSSSSSSTHLTDEFLQNIPSNVFQPDIINSAPGVNYDVAFGGTDDSNALLMDGVNVSDPEGGSPWAFFNYNWIQEVEIVALGANAEYGEFTGIAANSVVRSGSNNFSGLVEFWTVPKSWTGDNTGNLPPDLQETFEPNETAVDRDFTAQIGGRIIRDKLFFFSGFQYYDLKFRPAGFTGGYRTEQSPRFLTKVDWSASDDVRLQGFFEKDKYDVTGRGADPFRPPETTVDEPSPEINWNVRLSWVLNDNTFLDARNGGYSGYFPLEPTPPQTQAGPAPHYDLLTGLYSQNAPYFGRFDRKPIVTAVTLTKYAEQFAGRHELKFGFEYEHATVTNEWGYPADILYYDYGGPYLAYLYEGYTTNATKKRATLYVQDAWNVSDKLTINPGVRINFNRGSVPNLGTVISTNPISPRIGVAFDPTGQGKTVFRAHWGRYHDALLTYMFSFMDVSDYADFITAEVLTEGGCANGLGPDCVELDRFSPETSFGIDENITQPYVDQFLVGVDHQLMPNFSLQAQYIRRAFKNFMAFIDTGSRYEPVLRQDPGPDNELGTSDDGSFLTVYNLLNPGEAFRLLTNPESAFRDYDAFQIVADKRFSNNWQLLGSYTWSKAQGNVDNTFGSNAAGPNSLSSTSQNGVFANPNKAINADGRATFDNTHQVKIAGTYNVPVWGGISISGTYRYLTGDAWGRRADITDLDQGRETVRIETRGTRRVGAENNFDFRVEKTFPLGGARSVGVFFNFYNMNNQGVADNDEDRPLQDLSGSSFGDPRFWIDPRTIRLGARFQF